MGVWQFASWEPGPGQSGVWRLGASFELGQIIPADEATTHGPVPAGSFRVLESINAGKRLPEARFETLGRPPTGKGSVLGMFGRRGGQLDRGEPGEGLQGRDPGEGAGKVG